VQRLLAELTFFGLEGSKEDLEALSVEFQKTDTKKVLTEESRRAEREQKREWSRTKQKQKNRT
jgi:hypothetical protein